MSEVASSSPQVPPASCKSVDKKFLDIQVDLSSSSSSSLSSTEKSTTYRRDEQITTIIRQFCPFLVASVVNEGGTRSNGEQQENSNTAGGNFLNIRPLTGGLSNHLFIVSPATSAASPSTANSTPNSVLVRIHPDTEIDDDDDGDDDDKQDNKRPDDTSSNNNHKSNSFSLVDRSIENRLAVWLAEQGLAPKVYGRFKNGRVEEFYANVEPLSCPVMKDYIPQIAESMADFHSLHAPSEVLPKPPPQSSSSSSILSSSIFVTVDVWLKTAHELLLLANRKKQQSPTSTLSSNDGNNNEIEFLNELQREWTWLSHQLSEPPQPSATTKTTDPMESLAYIFIRQVVVTHMDCQPLNILVEKSTDDRGSSSSDSNDSSKKDIRLIDFEYAGWNSRAADIGNTFCEFCEMSNLRADYEKEYPTAEHQDEYFRRYCKQSLKVPVGGGDGGDDIISVLTDMSNGRVAHPMIQQFIEALQCPENHPSSWRIVSAAFSKEVGRFSLISHLSWSLWSILKSQEDDGVPDFDYMVYARHRMDGYTWAKKKFF